jgi:hypothetical protein
MVFFTTDRRFPAACRGELQYIIPEKPTKKKRRKNAVQE